MWIRSKQEVTCEHDQHPCRVDKERRRVGGEVKGMGTREDRDNEEGERRSYSMSLFPSHLFHICLFCILVSVGDTHCCWKDGARWRRGGRGGPLFCGGHTL